MYKSKDALFLNLTFIEVKCVVCKKTYRIGQSYTQKRKKFVAQ